MKITINVYDFRDAFKRAGRENQFSYEGLAILFDYLEECETDIGEEHELDVVALCCDFAEAHYTDIAEQYSIDLSEIEDDDDQKRAVEDYLQDEGVLVGEVEGGFVFRQF